MERAMANLTIRMEPEEKQKLAAYVYTCNIL